MKTHTSHFTVKLVAVCALLSGVASLSNAQAVFRIVGPDGKVTFSDKPPAEAKAKVISSVGASAGAVASASLPFELRQVAQKYPVTLYTGENCVPCQSARSLLTTRGVPFAEKTVATAEDSQSLQRLSGENSLPFATIGGQQLKGFSDSEWSQFLTAAGYPAKSVLPSSYRQPAATPLVTAAAAPDPNRAPPPPAKAAAPNPQLAPVVANPSGIRF